MDQTATWLRVSRRLMWVDLSFALVGLVAGAAVGIALLHVSLPTGVVVLVAAGLVFGVRAAITPARVRSIGYRLRDDDLLVTRGVLFSRLVAVPYGRMQLIDMNRGPVARLLGLVDLQLVTAAAHSNVTIPGLTVEEADRLRDVLVDRAESRRVGL